MMIAIKDSGQVGKFYPVVDGAAQGRRVRSKGNVYVKWEGYLFLDPFVELCMSALVLWQEVGRGYNLKLFDGSVFFWKGKASVKTMKGVRSRRGIVDKR